MKNIFVAIAMVMGIGAMAMAQDVKTANTAAQTTAADSTTTATQATAPINPKFETIDLTTVPEVVTNAFKTAYPETNVSDAASATIKGVLVYRLNYKDAEGVKSSYFTADGKEVK